MQTMFSTAVSVQGGDGAVQGKTIENAWLGQFLLSKHSVTCTRSIVKHLTLLTDLSATCHFTVVAICLRQGHFVTRTQLYSTPYLMSPLSSLSILLTSCDSKPQTLHFATFLIASVDWCKMTKLASLNYVIRNVTTTIS